MFVHEDLYYEVSEFVDGQTLEDWLDRRRPLAEGKAVSLANCVLQSLAWLHGLGIVHRDIKPSNIMVFVDDRGGLQAKLVDLGIALHVDRTRITVTGMVGTYLYAAPEMFLGAEGMVDGRADLHALGVTLFEALAGKHPFSADTIEGLIKQVCGPARPSLEETAPHVSPALCAFVARLIRSNQDERYATAEDALAVLNECTCSLAPTSRPVEGTVLPHPSATSKVPDLEWTETPEMDARPPDHVSHEAPASGHVLDILTGPFAGRIIPVPLGGFCIGRSMVNPEDGKLSRFHARAIPLNGAVKFVDLKTANRLLFRGRRRRRLRLKPGEEVTLGVTVLRLSDEKEGKTE